MAAESGALQQHPGDGVDHHHDDDWDGNHTDTADTKPGNPARNTADGVAAGIDKAKATGHAHGGECDDDGGHLAPGDKRPVEDADAETDEQAGRQRNCRREAGVHHQASGKRSDKRHDSADRQVDTAGQNDERHADCQNANDGNLPQHVHDVVEAEEIVARKPHQDGYDNQTRQRQGKRRAQHGTETETARFRGNAGVCIKRHVQLSRWWRLSLLFLN